MVKSLLWSAAFGFSFLLVSGCGSFVKRHDDTAIEDASLRQIPGNSTSESTDFGQVPVDRNAHVERWIKYFQGRGRPHMERYLMRSTRYTTMMRGVLKSHGLPEDLIYVPLIESGFSSSAASHASAVGYWQFIRSTGKQYGLKIDNFVDERRDPLLSTDAAAEYFKSLYSLFGDWYLALAAYNVGENRVKRAVMRYNTRDFWKLVKYRRSLPRETKNYVPKFLAALLIAKNPGAFGFDNVDYHPQLKFDVVEVKQPVSLMTLAKQLGIPYQELKKMNPRYRSDFVPIYSGDSSTVRVPPGYQNAAYAAVPRSVASAPKVVTREYFYYRVRRGDTLSEIAQRHRTHVSTLRRLNNLRSRSLLRVGQRLKVPERIGRVVRYQAQEASESASSNSEFFVYRVRRGDTLSEIADRHRISLSKLKRINGLSPRSILRVGQRIKIPGRTSSKQKSHRVNRGESLTLIAKKYGVSVSQLTRWNKLSRHSVLYVGQKLRLNGGSSRKIHVVKRGDTLIEIAQKYGVSIPKLTNANDIKNKSTIMVGSRLINPR